MPGPSESPSGSKTASEDSWETGQQLLQIERSLQAQAGLDPDAERVSVEDLARLDQPHAGPPPGHVVTGVPARVASAARFPVRPPAPGMGRSWIVLSLGTTVLSCGAALLVWGAVTAQQHLSAVGLPIALLGQVLLLGAAMLRIERLRQHGRSMAVGRNRPGEIKKTAHPSESLTRTDKSPEDDPEVMLADLKHQLDTLAKRIDEVEP